MVTEMDGIQQRTLGLNEFQVSDVPPGKGALLGDVVVFNVDGNFCATQATCTHRGGPLAQGKLDGSTVTCPLHGSQFNVCSGAVVRGPAMDPLRTYRILVNGNVGRVETSSTEA
jgi:nitrite reductase/ring-hydroxylating ferredoxin subunit